MSVLVGSIRSMHPQARVDAALALVAQGLTPTEIGRRLGLPKSTIQYWCRRARSPGTRARRQTRVRCHGCPLDEGQYLYLLGYYLGDGHIAAGCRRIALTLSCADDWPGVRQEVQEALRAVMPSSSVCLVARTGCHAVTSYSNHWPCLFPQHGPGKKHTRSIALASWQSELVERDPGRLLRGLFHSDGCRVVNWTRRRTASGMMRYEYPRYLFSNKSEDILGICASALAQLDIPYRRPRWDTISVARRAGVAALDAVVGPKY